MKLIDLVGKRFGNLVVLERVYKEGKKQTFWRCSCDCGNETIVEGSKLKNGHTKSCGCLKHSPSVRRIDLTGMRFGRLLVNNMIYESGEATRCNCTCDCGKEVVVRSHLLIRGVTKSCGCYKKDTAGMTCMEDLTGQTFGEWTVLERVKCPGRHTRYICECSCGTVKDIDGASLKNGQSTSCGCCRNSKGELYVKSILDEENINYVRQYKFDDCLNIRPLAFDFFLPDNNLCIEYQGIQHYKDIPHFRKDGKNSFEYRQNNDQIKRDYCNDKNIELLEIPYYLDRESQKELLMSVLNP